ncbi:MAG TPA: Ig-like domain-containing protein [Chryseolinea sp.]
MMHFYKTLLMMSCWTLLSLHSFVQAQSPNATKVFEYKPAPGQFINTGFGSPADAQGVLGPSDNGLVSIGGFGGYIVVGFDQPVKNDPQNPYGVDFTITGNGFPGWSEPGSVMVMEDVNGNGLPDDTWYELAGSEYHFRNSHNVTTTYFNPWYASARDVFWETDLGESGVLRSNIFNSQPYYPQPGLFDNVGADKQAYSGRQINTRVNRANPYYITSGGLAFGYVDNKLLNDHPAVPRNPYFDDDNGSSADGFDISWAVDADGKPVALEKIHFVKVYNSAQADVGWLGESSTEVECFTITTPDPSYVPRDYFMHAIGAAPFEVLNGGHYQFEGMLFKNGIPQDVQGTWSVSDEAVGSIDQQGNFTATGNGEVTIQYSADDDVDPATFTLHVVELVDVDLTANVSELYVNQKAYVFPEGITNRDEPDTHYAYDSYTFSVDDDHLAAVSETGVVTAKDVGVVTVTATSKSNPSVSKSLPITILEAPIMKVASDRLNYTVGTNTARVDLSTLFTVTGPGQIHSRLVNNSNEGLVQASVDDSRYLDLTFTFGKTGKAVLTLYPTVYDSVYIVPLTITLAPETSRVDFNKVAFVNGGQFGSKTGNVQLYDPAENKVEKLVDFEKAQSVQTLLVEDRYAYVSAEYELVKYDLVTKQEVAKRYLEDLSDKEADGKGTDGMGLNHSAAFYKDWIIVTRQNSYGPPEDGYNVRIYTKENLSLVKKIAVSTEASGVVVVGDSAFVALNGGFMGASGQLAIIDLKNLEKKEEYDFGSDGTSIMQLFEKDKIIYVLGEGKLITYDIRNHTHALHEIGIGHSDYSSTALAVGIIDGKLYTKYNWGNYPGENKGFGVIDLETMTVTHNDLMGLSTDSEIQNNGYALMASGYDQEAKRFYFTFGQWWGDGIGRIYNDDGTVAGDFANVEDSPERLAVSNSYMNQKPYASKALVPLILYEGESFEAALDQYFRDDDGEALAYSVTSDAPSLPTWITFSNHTLDVTAEVGVPKTTVVLTVTATDPENTSVSQNFSVTIIPVDDAPIVANPIADVAVDENAPAKVIPLAGVFTDEDDIASEMIYSISENTNDDLVTTSIAGDQLTLSFAPDTFGQSDITVEVTSGSHTATTKFSVTVKENTVTGIADEPIVSTIYPNPVSDFLVIKLNYAGPAWLRITKPDGTTALSQQINTTEATVNVSALAPALYILTIEQGNKKVIQKIVKK